jgi:hypothetical protein
MTQRAYDGSKWARARFRKSSRSNGGSQSNCVGVIVDGDEVAIGDTKAEVADSYAHLRVGTADFAGLLANIKSGEIV